MDARDPGFSGQIPSNQRGGHDRSRQYPQYKTLVDSMNKFKTAEDLAAMFAGAGVKPGDRVVSYCRWPAGRGLLHSPLSGLRCADVRRIMGRVERAQRTTADLRASKGKSMAKAKSDLLQGTLDLLILKTLELEPMHGWGISLRIHGSQAKYCKSIKGRFIRLCTAWKSRDGFRPRGKLRRITAKPNIMSSPGGATVNWLMKKKTGFACPARWRRS